MVRRGVHFFILYSGRPARAVSRPRLITARAALLNVVMSTRGQTSYDLLSTRSKVSPVE